MNIKRFVNSEFGRIAMSILLGLGLATLFRKVCTGRNCLIIKGCSFEKIQDNTFKYNDKCYTFDAGAQTCDSNKKIIDFA
jgi:hypothetical protein